MFSVPDAQPTQECLAAALSRYNAPAEKAGQLLPEQLAVVYEQRWFKMFVPRVLGGLELSLPEGLRLEESLARIDGSLGWTVTLCSGATMFIGYLPPGTAADLATDPELCMGGSGRPGGVAVVVPGGYRVSGQWPYATGAPHTTHFTANCFIEAAGKRLLDPDGQPVIRSFFFSRNEVEWTPDWHTIGLVATAGHSFSVKNLLVSADRSFIISREHATIDQPVYHFPFLQFAEATLAVNIAGMVRHFLDLCTPLLREKAGRLSSVMAAVIAPERLQKAGNELAVTRTVFYDAVEKAWQEQGNRRIVAQERLAAVSESSRALAATARQLVQALYPYCGMQAADPRSEINRVWRDLHTASQHSLLTFPAP